jgi:hypothetical protein
LYLLGAISHPAKHALPVTLAEVKHELSMSTGETYHHFWVITGKQGMTSPLSLTPVEHA